MKGKKGIGVRLVLAVIVTDDQTNTEKPLRHKK